MCLHPNIIDALVTAGASAAMVAAAYRAAWKVEREPDAAPAQVARTSETIRPGRHARYYLRKLPTYLYFVKAGPQSIKIGISCNIGQRLPQLREMGIDNPRLLGYFSFENRHDAKIIEAAAHERFPVCPSFGRFSKEIHAVTLGDAIAVVGKMANDRPFIVRDQP